MPKFEKGNKKGGRKKGSVNKTTAENRDRVQKALSILEETLPDDLRSLSPSEKVKTYTALLEYTLPKLQRVAHTGPNDERLKIEIQVIDDADNKD